MVRQEQVLKGAKRQFAKENPLKNPRLPMTPDILSQMRKVWNKEPSRFDNNMPWAACCLCYFGFLKAGEITVPSELAYDKAVHLNMEDLEVDNT
jgi:hypothetical protein